jgi:hypothetical protein
MVPVDDDLYCHFKWLPPLDEKFITATSQDLTGNLDAWPPSVPRKVSSRNQVSVPHKLTLKTRCWALNFIDSTTDSTTDSTICGLRFLKLAHASRSELHLTRSDDDGEDVEFRKRVVTELWLGVVLGWTEPVNTDDTIIYLLVVGKIHPEDVHLERIGVLVTPKNSLPPRNEEPSSFLLG